MRNGTEPKGFAGLASLVSTLEEKGRRPAHEAIADEEKRPVAERDQLEAGAGDSLAREEPREAFTAHGAKAGRSRSSAFKWLLVVVIGVVALYVLNLTQKEDPKTKIGWTGTPQTRSPPPVPIPAPAAPTSLATLEFSQPPVGRDRTLSIAELRWCIRVEIRYEAFEALPTTSTVTAELRRIASEYNSRCVGNRYTNGTLERARRELEQHRSELVASLSAQWLEQDEHANSEPAVARFTENSGEDSRGSVRDGASSDATPTAPQTAPPTHAKELADERPGAQAQGETKRNTEPSTTSPASEAVAEPEESVNPAAASELEYSQPPAGRDNVLNVAQIRWCLREQIRIETLRPLPTTNADVEEFNRIVSGYNKRCGSYRYRPGALARAEREVEQQRREIVAKIPPDWNPNPLERVTEPNSSRSETGTTRNEPIVESSSVATGGESVETVPLRPRVRAPRALAEGEQGRSTIKAKPPKLAPDTPRGDAPPTPETGAERARTSTTQVTESAERVPGPEVRGLSKTADTTEPVREVPTDPRQLTREIQNALKALGYEPGPVDGIYGAKTKRAIQAFERDRGMTARGNATIELWRSLLEEVTKRERLNSGSRRQESVRDGTGAVARNPSTGAQSQGGGPDPAKRAEPTGELQGGGKQANSRGGSYFTLGSHKDDVLRVQGKPTTITRQDYGGTMTWRYATSTVELSTRTNRVLQWSNRGNLRVRLAAGPNTTDAPYFTLGSHQDDVVRVQGTPSSIVNQNYAGTMTWRYGTSTVETSTRTNRVLQWSNRGNLHVRIAAGPNTTDAPYVTMGSHRDDVVRVQGTPTAITAQSHAGRMTWRYGTSTVEISTRTDRVLQWSNRGNLHVGFPPGPNTTDASYFTLDSHRDDVVRVQGTPNAITAQDFSGTTTWRYGTSTVEFSTRTNRVRQWSNRGNLHVGFPPGPNTTVASHFARRSHKDDVVRLQGTPNAITRQDYAGKMTWRYGTSTVEISTATGEVADWFNRGNLKVRE